MSSREHDQALEQIRKILRLSQDGAASEAEVDNAMRFMKKLMEKHNIEFADIEVNEAKQRFFYDECGQAEAYNRQGRIESFFKDLAWAPCYICEVKYYIGTKWADTKIKAGGVAKRRREYIVFYGLKRDVLLARDLYFELWATVLTMWRAYFKRNGWDNREYLRGLIDRVVERARVISQETTTAGAIVLQKGLITDKWAEANLQLTKGKATNRKACRTGAYYDGLRDGAKISLATGVSKAAQKKLGGTDSQIP